MIRGEATRRVLRGTIVLALALAGCGSGGEPGSVAAAPGGGAAAPSFAAVPNGVGAATTAILGGQIQYYGGAGPVGDVTVTLTGPTTNASTLSDTAGQYAFGSVANENLQLVPSRMDGTENAINSLDATYALQSVVGLRTLSADQLLAGDVSGNGAVTAFDASLILQHVVGQLPRFPAAVACGSDWLFVPTPAAVLNQQAVPPLLTSGSCRPGMITYTPLTQDATAQSFRAIVIGDCTGNWTAPTPTPTPTVNGTPTRTPTLPVGGAGPKVLIAAAIRADGCMACDAGGCLCGGSPTPTPAYDGQGHQVFQRNGNAGFLLVVEADAGTNGDAPGSSLPAPCSGGGRPALEIEASQPLGDGSAPFCPPPPTPAQVTGVPGFPAPDFGSSQAVLDALQAFGSRFRFVLLSDSACTLDGSGNPNFLSAVPPTPVGLSVRQYCYVVSPSLHFPGGDTLLTLRVADGSGVPGPIKQIVVRLPTATPTS